MQDIEILRVIDQMVKEVYDGDLEERGHSVSNANVILKYLDGEMEVSFKLSKKQALNRFFEKEKTKGNFKNVNYEKFEELYNEGIPFEKIEEEAKKGTLPFDEEEKKEND